VSTLTLWTTATHGQPFGAHTKTFLGQVSISGDTSQLELNLVSTLWLIFLLPYSVNRLAEQRRAGVRVSPLLYVSLLLAAASTVFGGQRSIYIALGIGLVIAALSPVHGALTRSREAVKRSGLMGPLVALIGCAAAYYVFAGENLRANLTSLLASRMGDDIRAEQAKYLWAAFLDAPVWGHGLGYVIPDYVRSADFPWSYELAPLVILMSYGLLGSAALFGAIALMFVKLLRAKGALSSRLVVPILAGSASAFIASAVNPVVTKLGTIWMILIPLVVLQAAANTMQKAVTPPELKATPLPRRRKSRS
jgi:hypothetical protein